MSGTRLIVSVQDATAAGLRARALEAVRCGADVVEVRLDALDERPASLRGLVGDLGVPVIATCRSREEGGAFDGGEDERIAWLEEAAVGGAAYIDCEMSAWERSAHIRLKIGRATGLAAGRAGLILSCHDLKEGGPVAARRMAALEALPADVHKYVALARGPARALEVLDLLADRERAGARIVLAMGEAGEFTRLLARKLGAWGTFASLAEGEETAEGQISVREMREVFRWGRIGAETDVYGVVGWPVKHSLSPLAHNLAFEQAGVDAVYVRFAVPPGEGALAEFLDGLRARPWLGVRGLSVTLPHKRAALDYVIRAGGRVDEHARSAGAVNTIWFRQEGLEACNTDVPALVESLRTAVGDRAAGRGGAFRAVVLGAGGAARAAVVALRSLGAEIVVCNRTYSRAAALAEEFGIEAVSWSRRHELAADVIVNATPLGMWPAVDDAPLDVRRLRGRPVIVETIYNPPTTRLLREAAEAGCHVVDGVGMFVGQAVRQFELWTGRPAPREAVAEAVRSALAQQGPTATGPP